MKTNLERGIAQREEALRDITRNILTEARKLQTGMQVKINAASDDIINGNGAFDGLVRLMQMIELAAANIASAKKEIDWYRAGLIALLDQRNAAAPADDPICGLILNDDKNA